MISTDPVVVLCDLPGGPSLIVDVGTERVSFDLWDTFSLGVPASDRILCLLGTPDGFCFSLGGVERVDAYLPGKEEVYLA